MIRVLHVIGSLNNGGSQAMVMNLYRNIDRSKIQFDFVIHREDETYFAEEIKSLGGNIFFIPKFDMKNVYGYIKSWDEFFKSHAEYKIIHGHVRSTAAIYLKIAKKYGLVTISHSHSTSSGNGVSAWVKNTMQYPIRYVADYFFACSKTAGVWLFGESICESKNFFLLNNAIDSKKFIYNEEKRREKREELKIENNFVIGHIGRFSFPKNHSFLIDIFKEVNDRDKDSVLILVGDGELKKEIEEKVSKLNLNKNIIFTGVKSNVEEYLQAMDVFVFPSIFEGLPVTLIEAQATGLPCIISDIITKEVYVTENIESISINTLASQWADMILKYKNSYKRKNLYSDIKNSGYDIDETAKFIEKFYLDNIK